VTKTYDEKKHLTYGKRMGGYCNYKFLASFGLEAGGEILEEGTEVIEIYCFKRIMVANGDPDVAMNAGVPIENI